jgi:hypothetical protein
MSLSSEAGYLYIYSKELLSINKQLRKLGVKAEKHVKKHQKAKSKNEQLKYQEKHARTRIKIEKLLKKHNHVIKTLKHHHLEFYNTLRKEHKI